MNEEDLIACVRARIVDPKSRIDSRTTGTPRLYGVATPEALDAAAAEMGVPLPALLRRLYSEVENGGFGPATGLIGVSGGHTNIDGESLNAAYTKLRVQGWPEGILPLCDWGDGAWACVDARTSDQRIVTMDESGPTQTNFTLRSWLEAWVSGADLLPETFEIEDGILTNPFTQKPMAVKRRGRARGTRL